MNSAYSPLLTDLYQLTMAYGYWKEQLHQRESVFHLYYRKNPFGGRYALAAGLAQVLDYLENFRFSVEEIQYLGRLNGADGKMLFDEGFLNYLQRLRLTVQVDAVPEGTVVFPNTPLLRVRGELLQGQLLETALLNLINFPTLVATKASRVVRAAAGDLVLEFGLRRAQGPDGGLTASRAAYVGGCHGTSNLLAGHMYGVPVRGTHAHSWVMSFPDEETAFRAYARNLPGNTLFLVDTFDTLEGVRNAIVVGQWLKEQGHSLGGIRLDSGDMLALSIAAREMLDAAGFSEAAIVASGDLDEYEIERLKSAGAKINVWGVGTRLVTCYDQPALGGVYKLGAIRDLDGTWQWKIKKSNEPAKASTPGILQVRRYRDSEGRWLKDLLFDEEIGAPESENAVDLLQPQFQNGQRVGTAPTLEEIRSRSLRQLASFDVAGSEYGLETETRVSVRKLNMLG